MFKIDDEVVIVNKRSKNFGKTAVVKNVNGFFSEVLISIKGGWSGWLRVHHLESAKKPSDQKIKDSTKKNVPFIFFPSDEKNLTILRIRDKIENDHDDTTVLFGDTFDDMKDVIINSTNDAWGYEEWNNIYVVCGEDYFHIGKEVVVKKI